jgi:hypothetical protein
MPHNSESAQRFLDAVQAAIDGLTVACAGVDSWRQQVAKTIGVNAEQAVRHFRTDGLQHCPKLEPVRVAYCVTCLGCEAQLRIALRISSKLALLGQNTQPILQWLSVELDWCIEVGLLEVASTPARHSNIWPSKCVVVKS